MADSINRSHGETQAQGRDGIDLERGPEAPAVGDEAQDDATTNKTSWWEAPKASVFSGSMITVATGYGVDNRYWKGGAFSGLSLYRMIKAAESGRKDPESTAVNGFSMLGTAVWATGIFLDDWKLQTAGPAINCTANMTSALHRYLKGKEGATEELIDGLENAAFTAAGLTGQHPAARALAFELTSLGFAWASLKDKGLVGHALGAAGWGAGAAMQSNTGQAFGSATVGAAEIARALYRWYENRVQKSASEAAPQQPGVELAPVQSSAVQSSPVQSSAPTPEPPVRAAAHLPPPPGAAASNAAALPAPNPVTSAMPSPVTSAASTPFVSAQSTPIPSRAPSPVTSAAPSPVTSTASTPFVSAQSTPIPSRAPSPVTSAATGSIASRHAPPTPESRPQSVPGGSSSRPSTPQQARTPVPAKALSR